MITTNQRAFVLIHLTAVAMSGFPAHAAYAKAAFSLRSACDIAMVWKVLRADGSQLDQAAWSMS